MLSEVILNSITPMSLKILNPEPGALVQVKSISGLSPTDFTLFTGSYSTQGGYYQGRRVGSRNLVFQLRLKPDYRNGISVSDIRDLLQEQFITPYPGGHLLQFIFVDPQKPNRVITGVLEKFESDPFAKDTSVSISVICPDPFIRAQVPTILLNAGGWVTTVVSYEGQAPTGAIFTIKMVSNSSTGMSVRIGDEALRLNRNLSTNQIITISTVEGDRWVKVDGVDVMNSLTSTSKWTQLYPNDNSVTTWGIYPGDGRSVITKIEYSALWWGV